MPAQLLALPDDGALGLVGREGDGFLDEVLIAGLLASMRWARAAEAKPPKTTVWIAPRRFTARMPITAAGIIGTTTGYYQCIFGGDSGAGRCLHVVAVDV